MYKKYLIIIFISFNFHIVFSNDTQLIEEEKNINNEKKVDKINRNFELYEYYVSFGQSFPIGSNLRNSFDIGKSVSIMIKTPYRITNVLNKFDFSLNSEIHLKNYKFKNNSKYTSNYNANIFYVSLEPEKSSKIKVDYAIGVAHTNLGSFNKIIPAFKLNLENTINLITFYDFLININFLKERNETKLFIKKIDLKVGLSPEIFMGYPGKKGDLTSMLDLYFKLNLFNL